MGGTLGELLVPVLCGIYFFWKREVAATAFCGFWFFENCCSTLAISSPVSKIREKPSVVLDLFPPHVVSLSSKCGA